jgi:hypothetical protein
MAKPDTSDEDEVEEQLIELDYGQHKKKPPPAVQPVYQPFNTYPATSITHASLQSFNILNSQPSGFMAYGHSSLQQPPNLMYGVPVANVPQAKPVPNVLATSAKNVQSTTNTARKKKKAVHPLLPGLATMTMEDKGRIIFGEELNPKKNEPEGPFKVAVKVIVGAMQMATIKRLI